MDNKSKPSDLGMDTQLKEATATPFTLLLALYNAKLAIKLRGWKELDLLKQCEYLQSDRINSRSKRKTIMNELVKDTNFIALKHKSYLRIRIKSVLAQFYRETQNIKSSTNVSQWTGHDIMLSFICHLISISQQEEHKKAARHQKVWQFADFMRGYFRDTQYNGHKFLTEFEENKKAKSKGSKGFGLKIMRNVCNQFHLKSGPYSKVKKQCNNWALNLHNQSNGIGIQNIGLKVAVNNKNKYVSTVAEIINENNNSSANSMHEQSSSSGNNNTYVTHSDPSDVLNGKSWYWFCDYGGLKWIPYRQDDVKKINTAWRNKQKSAVIKSGSYRVEFDYSNAQNPSGSQYNNSIANPNGRMVMCTVPQSRYHGVDVDTRPL